MLHVALVPATIDSNRVVVELLDALTQGHSQTIRVPACPSISRLGEMIISQRLGLTGGNATMAIFDDMLLCVQLRGSADDGTVATLVPPAGNLMDKLEPVQSAPYSCALGHGIGNGSGVVIVPRDPVVHAYQVDTEARGV